MSRWSRLRVCRGAGVPECVQQNGDGVDEAVGDGLSPPNRELARMRDERS